MSLVEVLAYIYIYIYFFSESRQRVISSITRYQNFSLVLCFCVHLCFLICLYLPILLCFPEQLSHLTIFGASITYLNEPPRALAASTIAWVMS